MLGALLTGKSLHLGLGTAGAPTAPLWSLRGGEEVTRL